jgi:hypothetical protein
MKSFLMKPVVLIVLGMIGGYALRNRLAMVPGVNKLTF